MTSFLALRASSIDARDGALGSVSDLYFDDRTWTMRYLVIDTGKWFPGRRVLVPPDKIRRFDETQAIVAVDLSRAEIEARPRAEEDPPISEQHELLYMDRYSWLSFPWGGFLGIPSDAEIAQRLRDAEDDRPQSHLRSAAEVLGYDVLSLDGKLGKVHDLEFQVGTKSIDHLVADVGGPFQTKVVPIPTTQVRSIDEGAHAVHLSGTSRDLDARGTAS